MGTAPQGTSLGAIQYWVCGQLGYTGKKSEQAREATFYAMGWWHTRSDTYIETVDHKVAKKACGKYVKRQMMEPVGFFAGIFLAIFVQVVVSAVVRIILAWLFNDKTARKALRDNEQHKYMRGLARLRYNDESLAVYASPDK